MAKRDFPPAFKTFISKHINSVEQIEVLLLLLANAERDWGIAEISAILRSSPPSITARLEALKAVGLAVGSPEAGYRYAATGHLHRMVELLAEEYGARRFSVIELVFSKPDPMRSFADAFLLRDQDNDDR